MRVRVTKQEASELAALRKHQESRKAHAAAVDKVTALTDVLARAHAEENTKLRERDKTHSATKVVW